MLQESEDNEAEEEFPTFAPGIAGAVIHKEKLPTPTSTPPPLSSIVDTAKVLNPSSETGSLNTVGVNMLNQNFYRSCFSWDLIYR